MRWIAPLLFIGDGPADACPAPTDGSHFRTGDMSRSRLRLSMGDTELNDGLMLYFRIRIGVSTQKLESQVYAGNYMMLGRCFRSRLIFLILATISNYGSPSNDSILINHVQCLVNWSGAPDAPESILNFTGRDELLFNRRLQPLTRSFMSRGWVITYMLTVVSRLKIKQIQLVKVRAIFLFVAIVRKQLIKWGFLEQGGT